MGAAIARKGGPTRTIDLAAALMELQTEVPSLGSVWIFGSRVHQTGSVRSDIDLLATVGSDVSLPKLATTVRTVEPYLDVFAVLGSAAVSVANNSRVEASSQSALREVVSATLVWDSASWVGPSELRDHHVPQGVRTPVLGRHCRIVDPRCSSLGLPLCDRLAR